MNKAIVICDIKNFIKNSLYRMKYKPIRAKKRNVYYCLFETHKKHSGLGDRLKTVITQYNIAKANGYQFKLFWETPFRLSDYLKPKQDWEMKWDDLEYSLFDTKIISEVSWRQITRLKKDKQYHCYRYAGNSISRVMPDTGYKWNELFDELFEPGEKLLHAYGELGVKEKSYIAIHARFCNALEKFENTYMDNHIESQEEREALIKRCQQGIIEIKEANPDKEVYVLSDSKVFLDSLAEMPVKTLNHDNVGHVSENGNDDTYLKTFLDMYFISKAASVYRMQAPELLSLSGFAQVAAFMGDAPFYNKKV